MKVDHPNDFHGTVDLHNSSLADLAGLAQAANSWTYHGDVLTIFDSCGKSIDKLHVLSDATTTGSIHGLAVSKSAAGDVLVIPGTAFSGTVALPTV